MDEQSLALSFGDSLTEDVSGCIGEFVEVGLDSILEDGLLKDIPFISTAVSIYRIGKSIHERHHISKLAVFLNEINKNLSDEGQRQKYRHKFQENEKFRNQELEYVLILIDRYIGYDKPQMLAKLYLAYLDGLIRWEAFTEYAETLDRLMPSDFNCLFHFMCHGGVVIKEVKNISVASVLRLLSVGFVEQQTGMTWADISGKKKKEDFDYCVTDFGKTFIEIIEEELRKRHRKESD